MPPLFTVAVPWFALSVIVMAPVDGPSPPNVSFVNTGIVTLASSFTLAKSLSARGKSFTGVTVIYTIAVSQSLSESQI